VWLADNRAASSQIRSVVADAYRVDDRNFKLRLPECRTTVQLSIGDIGVSSDNVLLFFEMARTLLLPASTA